MSGFFRISPALRIACVAIHELHGIYETVEPTEAERLEAERIYVRYVKKKTYISIHKFFKLICLLN
jgi:hypothetical protein